MIEKRDREVIEKFRGIVETKEQRRKKGRVRLAAMLLILACAGLFIFYKNDVPPPVTQTVMHKSNTIALQRVTEETLPLEKEIVLSGQSAGPSQPVTMAAVAPDLHLREPAPDLKTGVPAGPPPETPVPAVKETTTESVPVFAPRVKKSGKAGLFQMPEEVSADANTRIADLATCQGVKNKQPAVRQNTFSLRNGVTPYIWMDVRSKTTPYKLSHVYYLNGRRYCEVPLAIHYPRMRTWSNVSLRHPHETGQWRVDVVTASGKTLSRIEFTVVH